MRCQLIRVIQMQCLICVLHYFDACVCVFIFIFFFSIFLLNSSDVFYRLSDLLTFLLSFSIYVSDDNGLMQQSPSPKFTCVIFCYFLLSILFDSPFFLFFIFFFFKLFSLISSFFSFTFLRVFFPFFKFFPLISYFFFSSLFLFLF